MDAIEGLPAGGALPQASVGWEASIISSLLATALLDPESEFDLVAEATEVFQYNVLLPLRGEIDPEAASLIEGPVVDIVELVDCVGPDAIEDAINWAYSVLGGGFAVDEPEALDVLADCLGWGISPAEATPVLKASLLIASLTASFNKYLASRSS